MTPAKLFFNTAILTTAFICGGSGPATHPSIPQHLAVAQTLVDSIDSNDNLYAHQGCFIKWKGENGATKYENRSDCSDFLALLIEHTYRTTPQQIKQWTGQQRPYANAWHDAIVAHKGFTQITRLEDAQPGDVIAIKFPPDMPDTGHIMMFASNPQPMTSTDPIVADTNQWKVTIIDSTRSPHGKTDTRMVPGKTGLSGVGRGVVRIYTHLDGTIAGYAWSENAKSKFDAEEIRNLVIGRLNVAKPAE